MKKLPDNTTSSRPTSLNTCFQWCISKNKLAILEIFEHVSDDCNRKFVKTILIDVDVAMISMSLLISIGQHSSQNRESAAASNCGSCTRRLWWPKNSFDNFWEETETSDNRREMKKDEKLIQWFCTICLKFLKVVNVTYVTYSVKYDIRNICSWISQFFKCFDTVRIDLHILKYFAIFQKLRI